MLARAGEVSPRPEGLGAEFGLFDEAGTIVFGADALRGVRYRLSDTQAQAILDLRLHRLTGLERDKIVAEYGEILERIRDLGDILARPERLMAVIRAELLEVREQFADARRTEINRDHSDLTIEDLIEDQPVVVTLSRDGYAKAQPITEYRRQNRGGRGRAATAMKEEDFIDKLFVAQTHDTLLCFSNRGRVYWLKVYQLPIAGRGSRGKPIVNLLPLEDGERINAMLPIREYPEDRFVFMATSQGTVKKTPLEAFSRPRTAGIIAVTLDEGDRLVGVDITNGDHEVMLCTTGGKAIRFHESDVRPMGREAAGVRGIQLVEDQEVNALIVLREGRILTASENGYGKLTEVDEFPVHGRGGQGVIALQLSERNGRMVAAMQLLQTDDFLLISQGGTLVRTAVDQVSVLGRNTQGVRLMRVEEGDRLVGLARVEHINGEQGDDEDPSDTAGATSAEAPDASAADAPPADAAPTPPPSTDSP
jgi:DNA gyrase subunit A